MKGSGGESRIPSLDGLRAVSILLVMCSHLPGTASLPRIPRVFVSGLGDFGVRVFFVISGFLITSLLVREEARSGTVSIGRFYLRRTLRIFPPFYVYIALIFAAERVGWLRLHRYDVLAAATYTTNYYQDRSWYLGHAWSLSVEEQFYLLWPFAVTFLKTRRAAHVALATVVAAPLLRLFLMSFAPSFRPGIGQTFPTVADSIATGCLLAYYRPQITASPALQRFLRSKLFWLVPFAALAAVYTPSAKLHSLVGYSVTNLGVALVIHRAVWLHDSRSGRLLNLRPVVFVGTLSYSLYLWQQPFLNPFSHEVVNRFPLAILLSIAAALASYYLVERPALRFRSRLERRLRTPAPTAGPG